MSNLPENKIKNVQSNPGDKIKAVNPVFLNRFLSGVLIASFVFCFLLFFANMSLKKQISHLDQDKEIELKERISREKELIRRDLEEKHAADMVSYQAMAKRLELEKKKVKELEEKMSAQDSATQGPGQ